MITLMIVAAVSFAGGVCAGYCLSHLLPVVLVASPRKTEGMDEEYYSHL